MKTNPADLTARCMANPANAHVRPTQREQSSELPKARVTATDS